MKACQLGFHRDSSRADGYTSKCKTDMSKCQQAQHTKEKLEKHEVHQLLILPVSLEDKDPVKQTTHACDGRGSTCVL